MSTTRSKSRLLLILWVKYARYLLSYDAITFHSYLETILASSNSGPNGPKQNHSPWLLSDAANVIFKNAKARCYTNNPKAAAPTEQETQEDAEWATLNEIERGENGTSNSRQGGREAKGWKEWMPKGMEPVLEELPKWMLLAEILREIETDMIAKPPNSSKSSPCVFSPVASDLSLTGAAGEPGSNVVLVMANDNRTCALLREFLSTMHLSPHSPGRHMMLRRLRSYLWWKGNLSKGANAQARGAAGRTGGDQAKEAAVSEAMKKKDAERAAASANRRRVRGGATAVANGGDRPKAKEKEKETLLGIGEMEREADKIAEL